jgi:ataxia telangiectasia mutated family protein
MFSTAMEKIPESFSVVVMAPDAYHRNSISSVVEGDDVQASVFPRVMDHAAESRSIVVKLVRSYICLDREDDRDPVSAHSSLVMSRALLQCAFASSSGNEDSETSEEHLYEGKSRDPYLLVKALAIRLCLPVAFSQQLLSLNYEIQQDIAEKTVSFLDDLIKLIETGVDEGHLQTEIVPFVEGFVSEFLCVVPLKFSQQNVRHAFRNLKEVFCDMLERIRLCRTQIQSNSSWRRKRNIDFDDEEEEEYYEDFPADAEGKRKRSVEQSGNKKRRAGLSSLSTNSLTSARSIASILINLEPSLRMRRFVLNQLSLVDADEDGRPNSLVDSFDIVGAEMSLDIVFSRLELPMETNEEEESLLSMCIETIQRIRDGTHGGDENFCSGFFHLKMILHREVKDVSNDDTNLLVHVLMVNDAKDTRWLKMRPHLLLQRLECAVTAYEKSGSSFRALFSRMFNSEFVIEALNSHSLSMRVASAHVVGVTLRNLANQDLVSQKVIEALIFGRVNDESPILATITDAQKSRDDSLCWKHSAVFVRYSVAYVWGVIGGCTRELSVCRDKLFDCIHMASLKTPYQPICQIAIRKMASLRGYLSAQAFVSDETESLWLKWMSSLPESRAFPLNLSSGELLHGVRDMGLIWIYSWRSSDDEGEIIKVLTDEVSKDFLSANVQRAIPLCLSLLSSKELDLFDLGEYSSVSSNLMARIRNMNIVSQDESERERTPLAFVSTLAPSIIAFALLRRLSVSEKIEAENPLLRFGLNLILRNEIIDPTNNDLLETRYRKVHSIIKVFLDMSGSSVAAGEVPGCKIPDLLGLDMYTPSDWPDTGDVFRLGAIEFLMQCKYLLFKAQTDERRVMRWKALEWVASKIVEDQSFCSMVHEMTLQTMLGLLWSREMLCCHEHALSFLREHMQSSIKTLTSGERSQSFIGLQLLLTLVEIHGRSSKAIAEEIRKHSVGKNDGSHSFGLLSFEVGTNAGGVWGWDAFDVAPMNLAAEKDRCLGILDPRHVSLARLTYDVLNDMLLILTHSSISESMVTLVEEENLEHLLCFLDEKFSILQLLKDHIDKRPEVDDSEQLSAAKSRLICSMQELSTTDYLFEGSQGVQELSLDSRLLMYHFRDLRRILTHSSSNYRSLPTVEDYAIVRYLLNIASDRSKPNKLRVEASKCIGAFGSSYIASLSMIDGAAWPENWLAEIEPKRDSLHLVCISRSLRFLLEHVRLDQPPLTLAVLTACKEVARTQEGVDALSLMKESREKTFMASLLQAGLKPRKKPTLLAPPSSYMGDIMELAKERNESEMTSANWCWSTKLWDVTDTSFEEWMKRIVCSLIICCYSGKTVPGEVRGSRSSFRAFAKVSALSSSISSHIFPWLVIDLLFSDQHPTAQNNELVDQTFVKEAWIGNPQSLANKRISQCFNIVIKSLKNCVEGDSRGKICNVLAETIDLLRKISQKLFLAHESFPLSFRAKEDMRIPGTLDNIVVGVSKKPRSFGSVLNIPPVSTVEAFVGAGRIASAAYFAESALLRTGFKTLISPDDLADRKKQSGKTRETQSSLMSLLRDCMIDLQEFDNASAFSLNLASLNFSGMGFRLADHVLLDNADPYNALKLLSNGEPVGGSRKTAIALALGTLGTKEALDAYINTAIRDGQLCEDEKSNLKEIWVEATLKGMHWSEVDSTIDGESILSGRDSGPFEDLLTAFGSLVRLDYPMFGELVASSRLRALEQIMSKYSRESTLTKIIPSVECFETLNDLDGIAYDHESRQSVIRHWVREQAAFQESFYRIPLGRFSDLDVAIREATLRALRSEEKFEKIDLYECYLTHLWQSSAIARRQGRSDLMQRCIQRLEIALKGEQECDRLSHLAVRFEEASLMESRGYSKVAIYAAKLISTELNELLPVMDKPRYFDVERLRAESLVSCGTWASRYGAESAKDIQEDYLLPAMQVCKDLYNERKTPSSTRRLADACIALAQNSASLFENVEGHMNSKEWRDKDEFLQEQQTLLDHLETQKKSQQYRENEPSEDKILRTRVRMMVEQLEDEISGEDEALKKYAELALQSFGHAFELADNSSDENWTRHAFQMISIWFTVSARLPEINSGLKEVFLKIPSYRFVPLVYQLFARLNAREGEEFNPFQELLRDVVVGVCHDHPYHCILQLLALIHSQDCGTSELYDTKVLAAKRVLEELRRIAGENRLKLYDGYEAVHQAYQSLAAAPLSKEDANSRKKQIAISSVVSKRECQLDRVVRKLECRPCILTKPPTLQPSHDYGGLRTDPPGTELLMEVLPHFDVADSGVTRPKVLHCKGSRGTKFKQLLKSSPSDDIRQDAVMQQVFTYTNKLMRQRGTPSRGAPEGQKRTCRNKLLRLVTYNAVPLSPTSGLLEWVEDTHSLNEYLTDRSHKTIGAHSRYCEGEWNHTTCMLKMKRAANRAHNFKRREFDEVCSNISPVLRYFFVERFGYDLQTWHTARMAYTRSCAVSSIVGHILGLGDRHNGNILIQRKTGELVHIDFGIVFEQGRLLPVPETVPFRLTRDIVDGLGPLGTEGAFTAVAEETISILRENASALLTILSSVVSDPLSQWKKASMRARGRQQCHEGNEDDKKKQEKSKKKENGCSSSKGKSDLLDNNLTAKHAITRIKEKLAGYEEGTSNEQHTVEGQVQLLINAARDPDNLCEIFHGWAAWL